MPQQGIQHQDAIESEAQLKPGSEEAGQTRVGPTPSPSTDESVSAYIERTLQILGCQETGLGITFLPPVTSADPEIERPPENEKTSQSDPIARTVTELPKENAENKTDGQIDLASEAGFSSARPDYFQTDTSDVEELLDSSGAETEKEPPKLIPLCNASTTCSEATPQVNADQPKEPAVLDSEALSPSRPLSASARTIIRQHFAETTSCILPIGHATVAFNANQVDSILRAMSNETITSSLHQMKNMLEAAIRVGERSQSGPSGHGRQRIKCFRKQSEGTNTEGPESDTGTGGYTSGVLSSDDEFVISSNSKAERTGVFTLSSPRRLDSTQVVDRPPRPQTPSPGYCPDDYEPLANFTTSSPLGSSPPRKRRRQQARTGKIMKEAYFKGIQWTRTFVTGPLDPEHNKHKFFCQICKTNVSISTKGAREIVRHFQCESHFRKDQRWRFEHLRTKDKVTGQVVHEVRGKNGQVLTPLELEREKQYFMAAPLIETGCSYPFYEDYMAGLGSLGTQAEVRLCVQISIVALFSPRCGDLNVLETLWSQIGTVTNHQTLFSPYDWGSSTLSVSIVNSWFQGPSEVFVVYINPILVVLFQTIFHHIFLCGVSDIAHHVSTSGYYSLEFETKGTYSYLSIRFWKKDTLCVVKLFRYRTASEPAAGVLMAISRLLSVLSVQPQIVSVSGCPAELIPVLEHSSYFERGIECPFRFDALSLPAKMHEKWVASLGQSVSSPSSNSSSPSWMAALDNHGPP